MQSMRPIDSIIVHSTATPPNLDVGVGWIRKLHIEQNGWSDIGYHYVIKRNGLIQKGRPIEIPGAHVKGMNANTIGVVYVGGVDGEGKAQDNRTLLQKLSLHVLLQLLAVRHKTTKILGHKECASTECPSFEVSTLRREFKIIRISILLGLVWLMIRR